MTQQYSHRNGETEPPTEAGWYWYADPFWSGIVVEYVADDEGGEFWGIGSEMSCGPQNLTGRFWGPLVPPWHGEDK